LVELICKPVFDAGTGNYYFSALRGQHPGFLKAKVASSSSSYRTSAAAQRSANQLSQQRQQQEGNNRKVQVEEIKLVFPDYGNAFITACLETFEWNSERTVDALLTNNLPPKLLCVDRYGCWGRQ
jgi:hypothetical protein